MLKIRLYDLEGHFLKDYNSIKEASIKNKINSGLLSSSLDNEITIKKFVFKTIK